MVTKEELLQEINDTISLGITHEHYQRTVDLAIKYSQIISGKDIEKLLKQFNRREDKDMFEQRVELTKQITPSICSTVMKTFNKVFRVAPATEVIDFEAKDEESVDDRIKEVRDALADIYGGKDIYKYMQDRLMYLSFIDPNSFIYTTFDAFDPNTDKPSPYNTEITSAQAINYEYINNMLQWLITKVPHIYLQDGKNLDGFVYTIYGPVWAFVYTQVGSDYQPQEGEIVEKIPMGGPESTKFEYYLVTEYEHKSDLIPVIQVGYERDLETKGVTFVSPIEAGMPYLEKSIKLVSEFDLTMCLHAFPQKVEYLDGCDFVNGTCSTSGKKQEHCDLCGKRGVKVHTSAQDVKVFKLPKNADPRDLVDLEKLIHYEYPPIDLLQFQDTTIDKYETKVIKAIFSSERFTKDQVAKTATGENLDMQNVYDTLKPFAEKVSDIWTHIAIVVSNYLGYSNVIVDHAYPNDFKLKTVAQLLMELKTAIDSGASGYIVASIEADIMREKYIDAPLEFQKYESKQKYFPFRGKSKDEVQSIIISGMVRESDIILYNYFETIFSELEQEFLDKKIWFYDMEPRLQRDAINNKVREILAQVNETRAISLAMGSEEVLS